MRGKVLRWGLGAVLLWVFWQLILSPGGLLQQRRLRERNEILQGALDSLRQVLVEREAEIVRLQHDTAYMEQIARTRLGLSRPGETVFRFVVKDSAASSIKQAANGAADTTGTSTASPR